MIGMFHIYNPHSGQYLWVHPAGMPAGIRWVPLRSDATALAEPVARELILDTAYEACLMAYAWTVNPMPADRRGAA